MEYNQTKENLLRYQKTWLVTGVAGFIGSNLAEELQSSRYNNMKSLSRKI